jgi:hypothetical protein
VLKRALIALVAIALLVAGAAFLAFNYLDVAVKWAFEHYGPEVTGVPVKVREVQISARNGRGSVRSLELGNPSGFSLGQALRFGEIRLAIDPSTVTQPVVVIHEISVQDASILYERGKSATNLETIQKNIAAYAKRASADAAKSDGAGKSGKRRFIVERLTLRGLKVTMSNTALGGQGIAFDLPDIELHDVGRRQGGLTASELADVVASALMQRIAQKVLGSIELLRKGGVEGAIDALKGIFR